MSLMRLDRAALATAGQGFENRPKGSLPFAPSWHFAELNPIYPAEAWAI
jgi:hypothetical protein